MQLEPAFLSGCACAQPLIRAKFFEVFDNPSGSGRSTSLLYVTCSQNWEAMGNHFWIKQCIEVSRCQYRRREADVSTAEPLSSLGGRN